MAKYKLKLGSHTIGGKHYKAGAKGSDILDLTDEQAKYFEEGRLIPLDSGEGNSNSSSSSSNSSNSSSSNISSSNSNVNNDVNTSNKSVDLGQMKDNRSDDGSVSLLDSNDISLITQKISTINDLTLLETLYNYEENLQNRQEVLDSIKKQYESLGSKEVNTEADNSNSIVTKKGKK